MLRGTLSRVVRKGVAERIVGDLGTCRESVAIGQSASLERSFSQDDIEAFSRLTWDLNFVHLPQLREDVDQDEDNMRAIVHGMLVASLIPTVFASRLPGSIYVSQGLSFKTPVYAQDVVRARVTVSKVKNLRGKCVMECETMVFNQSNQGAISVQGNARVLVP